jgi:hypothetical protein
MNLTSQTWIPPKKDRAFFGRAQGISAFGKMIVAGTSIVGLCSCQNQNGDSNLSTLQKQVQGVTTTENGVFTQTDKIGQDITGLREAIGDTEVNLPALQGQLIRDADISAWDKTFSALNTYATGLATLSGSSADSFSSSGESLANNLNSAGQALKLIPSKSGNFNIIATAIIDTGNLVTQYYVQRQVRVIMQKTDANIARVLDQMNTLVASLERTIQTDYGVVEASAQDGFAKVKSDAAGRLYLISKYQKVGREENQLISELQAFSKALMAVKQAHNKIAFSADKPTIANAVTVLQQDVKDLQSIYNALGKGS